MNDSDHISQEDLAFFAMQSLREEESEQVRRHLESCEDCRKELSSTLSALAALGASVEREAVSEQARDRFMRSISAETRKEMVAPFVTKKPTLLWIPWAVAAALVLVSVLLTSRIVFLQRELKQQASYLSKVAEENIQSQKVLRLLTEKSAQRITLTASKPALAPNGHAIYVADRGELIFQANNLKSLTQDKTYELWLIPANGSAPIPAGLFKPDSNGFASVVMPPLPMGVAAKAFGVTIENAAGSNTPTAPILLSGV